jgi:hypothetical protein
MNVGEMVDFGLHRVVDIAHDADRPITGGHFITLSNLSVSLCRSTVSERQYLSLTQFIILITIIL